MKQNGLVVSYIHDIRVSQIFLVEGNDAAFGREMRLEVLIGRGQGNSGIPNLDDHVRELQSMANGTYGCSHVAGEPIDGSTAGGELHVSKSLLHDSVDPSHFCALRRRRRFRVLDMFYLLQLWASTTFLHWALPVIASQIGWL